MPFGRRGHEPHPSQQWPCADTTRTSNPGSGRESFVGARVGSHSPPAQLRGGARAHKCSVVRWTIRWRSAFNVAARLSQVGGRAGTWGRWKVGWPRQRWGYLGAGHSRRVVVVARGRQPRVGHRPVHHGRRGDTKNSRGWATPAGTRNRSHLSSLVGGPISGLLSPGTHTTSHGCMRERGGRCWPPVAVRADALDFHTRSK